MDYYYYTKNRGCQPRNLIILMFFLLLSSINNGRRLFMAEGRAIQNPIQSTEEVDDLKEEDEKGLAMRKLIGSRPPSCEKRCRDCGHCEAVQVPIVPQQLEKERRRRRRRREERTEKVVEYSRGDDISNYKPLSWKCKCGDFIFNP